MRLKGLKARKKPLNLTAALIAFGKLRESHPECVAEVKLGERLVRELQYLHGVLRAVRATLPKDYHAYVDPVRLDLALARTSVYDAGEQT